MKLSNLFLSASIAASALLGFNSTAIAQRSYIVSVDGKTSEGATLKYDATSLDNYSVDYVSFTYYVIDKTGDLRSNRGIVACNTRNGWVVGRGDGSISWIAVSSTASVNMLDSICEKTGFNSVSRSIPNIRTGSCVYPSDLDSIGRRCGGRASSVRKGGR
ncbi:hypothetical protein ELBI_81 [Anabaena phage Elbi]|nr:hypothetical protein ELBI_81 [Anabaena phage Elbi]